MNFTIFLELFFLQAVVAGVLLAIMSSFLGSYLLQLGLSFLGDGLAHAAFGGVALGLWLGVTPIYTAIPAVILVAYAITMLPERAGISYDAAIGIFFSLSMALGIAFLSRIDAYTNDAMAYLFGSILAVDLTDIALAAGLLFAACLALPLWRRLALTTFDPELAQAEKLPVKRDQLLLMIFTAITVVIAIKMVGVVLVSAFLIIPAATAQLLAKRFTHLLVNSMLIACFGVVAGMAFSVFADLPSGAAIVILEAVCFLLVFGIRAVKRLS